ncbi:hypothetical protein [uncultured Lamprocystis sp.]|jgi:hypothetical protein|uniref:hypothetical protein n=1 Tax=uncultured Lamprocystis sp. TaxID=543132 RepID=UPI0025E3BC4F|nr:hypothetical protein [uncultured Lamprocystis sp.]
MQDRPQITTAIPKHRYEIGGYAATLLGEIVAGDARTYRYILAFVRQGQREPVFYVCAEPAAPPDRADGAYQLRVVSEALTEVVDRDDRWGELETFADQALKLGAQALGLQRDPIVKRL